MIPNTTYMFSKVQSEKVLTRGLQIQRTPHTTKRNKNHVQNEADRMLNADPQETTMRMKLVTKFCNCAVESCQIYAGDRSTVQGTNLFQNI